MASTRDKFRAVQDELNTVLLEREAAVENSLIALLTGEHYLQLGPPGVAKSYLVDQLTARITGASLFKILLNPSTTPDEVFGPVDLIELADHGHYTRRRTGSITDAAIAWCDETYKCNSVVLNGLLKIMNEREFSEIGMPSVHVPLLSMFGASNETPTDNGLQAFDDRFIIRELIQEISDDTTFIQMLIAPDHTPQAFVSIADIQVAQQEVTQVKGTTEVLQKIVELRHACSNEGVRPSQRRWKKALAIIKARAWLDGLPETDIEAMTCLTHVLWRDPKERKTVERIVYEVAAPLYLQAVAIEDQAAELMAALPREDAENYQSIAENVLVQTRDMALMLRRDIQASAARDKSRALAALTKVEGYHNRVKTALFQAVSRLTLKV